MGCYLTQFQKRRGKNLFGNADCISCRGVIIIFLAYPTYITNNTRAKSGASCWLLGSKYVAEMVSATFATSILGGMRISLNSLLTVLMCNV